MQGWVINLCVGVSQGQYQGGDSSSAYPISIPLLLGCSTPPSPTWSPSSPRHRPLCHHQLPLDPHHATHVLSLPSQATYMPRFCFSSRHLLTPPISCPFLAVVARTSYIIVDVPQAQMCTPTMCTTYCTPTLCTPTIVHYCTPCKACSRSATMTGGSREQAPHRHITRYKRGKKGDNNRQYLVKEVCQALACFSPACR